MEFRKAGTKDVPVIMHLIEEAKVFLRQKGVDQWQNGYPNEEAVLTDVKEGVGYVLVTENKTIGYACISFAGEPCYDDLKGNWLSQQPYAVIHRMTIDNAYKGRGLAGAFFDFAKTLCIQRGICSMKVDTDADNKMMQRVLKKEGFTYCGTVCFDNSEKIAFEKIWDKEDEKMRLFENWENLQEEQLEQLERKMFWGKEIMLVRNVIHPLAVLDRHSHPHEQMLMVLSGACDVVIGEEKSHLTEGGMAYFPSGVEHMVINTEDKPLIAVDIFTPIREDFLK